MTQETAIHRFVNEARVGKLIRVISRVRSGWTVLGDPQILPGYCVLYPDPVVADLHQLSGSARTQFLSDMADLGAAILAVTGAARINYEMLGNVEPALHAHVIPRYSAELEARRKQPIWLYDWNAAPAFDLARDRPLMERLAAALRHAC
jgi:diadenosine tetraphosphate (Ap4A) HIT family hydrolase